MLLLSVPSSDVTFTLLNVQIFGYCGCEGGRYNVNCSVTPSSYIDCVYQCTVINTIWFKHPCASWFIWLLSRVNQIYHSRPLFNYNLYLLNRSTIIAMHRHLCFSLWYQRCSYTLYCLSLWPFVQWINASSALFFSMLSEMVTLYNIVNCHAYSTVICQLTVGDAWTHALNHST